MNVLEALVVIEEGWNETLKPLITQGKYLAAYSEITNLSLSLDVQRQEFATYHHGIRWMASVIRLEKALEKNDSAGVAYFMPFFEIHLRQLKLATQVQNTF